MRYIGSPENRGINGPMYLIDSLLPSSYVYRDRFNLITAFLSTKDNPKCS